MPETATNFPTLSMAVFALFAGLVTLISGGEFLVSGAVKAADRLGVSPLIIGLTVVAFGTSMPELFVSLNAAISHHPGIMLGNVVGSNIANIALVLAVCAIIAPLNIDFRRLRVEFYLLIGVEITLVPFGLLGHFPRWAGLLFCLSLIVYTYAIYRRQSRLRPTLPKGSETENRRPAPYPVIIAFVGGGLFLMWLGSEYFIKGAVDLARFFGISELVIGLSVAAVGTSLPELASSLSAIRRNSSDILVGNIIGSNLFNLLMVMGITGLARPFTIPQQGLSRDIPAMLVVTLALVPIALGTGAMKRRHGLGLLAAYAIYIYTLGG